MSLKKKLFAMRKTFANTEIGANIYKPAGRPSPREVSSQKKQYKMHPPGFRKDAKIKMENKQD
ncbi:MULTISPECIES: hypothetical protein [Thermovenabulum]|uniref:Uncharacterized protein n=1 Tax=Thermovenabulum gondwanense TaxID=520767 RepID=A0A161PW96_9FIRM|nr:hypothetical protein [Thermovenabulum gondwanense]KYO67780.1 hypothetical protein ATZ99_04200 [Thermovenabulum gondwanense]